MNFADVVFKEEESTVVKIRLTSIKQFYSIVIQSTK